jgi:hypothetical protein
VSAPARQFASLDRDELRRRIYALADDGLREHDIAALTGLHPDFVKQVIGDCVGHSLSDEIKAR